MDNLLLLLFALPIATIILASVLETLIHCTVKVAAIFFAIFLVVTFAFFDETFLIFAIIYTIIAFLAAVITRFVLKLYKCRECDDDDKVSVTSATVNAVTATINAENLSNGSNNNSCGCNNNTRYRRF